jgi:hypothetical protein
MLGNSNRSRESGAILRPGTVHENGAAGLKWAARRPALVPAFAEHLPPAAIAAATSPVPAARLRAPGLLSALPPTRALFGRRRALAALPQQRTSRHPRTRPGTV